MEFDKKLSYPLQKHLIKKKIIKGHNKEVGILLLVKLIVSHNVLWIYKKSPPFCVEEGPRTVEFTVILMRNYHQSQGY